MDQASADRTCPAAPRRRRLVLLALGLFGVAVGVVCWRTLHQAEPVYQGRALRVWLRDYPAEANPAVKAIGTNAIPVLLRMLAEKDSAAFSVVAYHWDRFLQNLPDRLRRSWHLTLASEVNANALRGFEMLGTDAQQATPALIKLYRQKVSLMSQSASGYALIVIGPAAQRAALPYFVQKTYSSEGEERMAAASLLRDADAKLADPGEVVPRLVALLGDTNWIIRCYSVEGLAHYGTNAQSAVPGLIHLLDDPHPSLRHLTTNALLFIDPQAAAKAGIKSMF